MLILSFRWLSLCHVMKLWRQHVSHWKSLLELYVYILPKRNTFPPKSSFHILYESEQTWVRTVACCLAEASSCEVIYVSWGIDKMHKGHIGCERLGCSSQAPDGPIHLSSCIHLTGSPVHAVRTGHYIDFFNDFFVLTKRKHIQVQKKARTKPIHHSLSHSWYILDTEMNCIEGMCLFSWAEKSALVQSVSSIAMLFLLWPLLIRFVCFLAL